MAHPTCAPARPPTSPFAVLSRRATDAAEAVNEAYLARTCVRCLLDHAVDVPRSSRYFTDSELRALHAVIDSEIDRRLLVARAAIEASPVPRTRTGRT